MINVRMSKKYHTIETIPKW